MRVTGVRFAVTDALPENAEAQFASAIEQIMTTDNSPRPQAVSFLFGAHARIGLGAKTAWSCDDPASKIASFAAHLEPGWQSPPERRQWLNSLSAHLQDYPALPFLSASIEGSCQIPEDMDIKLLVENIEGLAAPLRIWMEANGGMAIGEWSPRTPLTVVVSCCISATELAEVRRWAAGAATPSILANVLPEHVDSVSVYGEHADGFTACMTGRLGASLIAFVFSTREELLSQPLTADGPLLVPYELTVGTGGEENLLKLLCWTRSWATMANYRLFQIDDELREVRRRIGGDGNSSEDQVLLDELAVVGRQASSIRVELGTIERHLGAAFAALATEESNGERLLTLAPRSRMGAPRAVIARFVGDTNTILADCRVHAEGVESDTERALRYVTAAVSLRSSRTMEQLTRVSAILAGVVAVLTVIIFFRGI